MTRDQLIDAFDGIDSRYILAAAARIEGGAIIAFRRQRLVRTVLIAAAITALLTATAYATGLFGLSTRRITPICLGTQTRRFPKPMRRRWKSCVIHIGTAISPSAA